jgi:uroporphyrinogen-III synthase
MRVIAFESRRAAETGELLRRKGLEPFMAPSVREVGLGENPMAIEFASRLAADEFEAVIWLTGVGVRRLHELVGSLPGFAAALGRVVHICRGPKPAKALRELGLKPAEVAPDPATARELLEVVRGRGERRVAVQEYGRPDERLLEGLSGLGCKVFSVPVYQWALPDDTGPLEEAVRRLHAGEADIAMFTSSVQLDHLLEVSEKMGSLCNTALGQVRIASIGPTMSERIRREGLAVWAEASPPKLGVLVQLIADKINQP